MEAPGLEKNFWQVYKDKGLVVLGIDLQESPQTVTPWANSKGLTYPILFDVYQSVWIQYGMGYIPHNVVIDTAMTVRYTNYGFSTSQRQKIKNTIEQYLPKLSRVSESSLPNQPISYFSVYPNPASETIHFRIRMSRAEEVKVLLYDLCGRQIEVALQEKLSIGEHDFLWEREERLPAGIYFVVLQTKGFRQTRKVFLIH